MSKNNSTLANEQLYCSLDLEFTGFDPSIDQILEIGFAFFKLSKKGFEVVEEWSQVFKPSIEVHPKILGLTGITQAELDEAPEFNEFRDELQSKLGDAIIVGHNPVMDIKFLESYGLKLSGKVIDTLELVQIILPTHHSYNLENLVHYFGIKHHKAHRALGDALSTIKVLENLLVVYHQFSDELKSELGKVMKRGEFLWSKLLQSEFKSKKLQTNDSLAHNSLVKKLKPLVLSKGLVTIDPIAVHHEARVALGLQKQNKHFVLAVNDSNKVMQLWQHGLAHAIFQTEDTFSETAFKKFLKNAQTPEELCFCLKIIVWLHTNWQTEAVLDLNISFFGGQFRQFIVGGKPLIKNEQVVVVDYATLQSVSFKDRELVITDLQSFEKFVSAGYGTRLSWSGILYGLRFIYNPESDFGNLNAKDLVVSSLQATDLFFGLTYMLLHRAFPGRQYGTIAELEVNHTHVYSRLKRAAENLQTKLDQVLEINESPELKRASQYLSEFFETDPNRVKWVDIDEKNLAFHNQPIDISNQVQKLIGSFQATHFTETLTNYKLLSYLVDRLGLDTEISEFPKKTLPNNLNVEVDDSSLLSSKLFELTQKAKLPLVIIMGSPMEVKDFYNLYYPQIKQKAALFAQGYSGGGNKMFRNFSINPKSILLVTADFMAKQNYLIAAKNVIISDPPTVETTHPYIAALISHWETKHPDLPELLAVTKLFASLKKIKMSEKITVQVFTSGKNFVFVDNTR